MFNLLTNIFCVADSNNNKGYLDITYPNKQLQGRRKKTKDRVQCQFPSVTDTIRLGSKQLCCSFNEALLQASSGRQLKLGKQPHYRQSSAKPSLPMWRSI